YLAPLLFILGLMLVGVFVIGIVYHNKPLGFIVGHAAESCFSPISKTVCVCNPPHHIEWGFPSEDHGNVHRATMFRSEGDFARLARLQFDVDSPSFATCL